MAYFAFYTYTQLTQQLKKADHSQRRRYVEWVFEQQAVFLRKLRWNDSHRQFKALWSYDKRLFLPAIEEYDLDVVSTRRCHMSHNSREYGFIATDISWPCSFLSWRY